VEPCLQQAHLGLADLYAGGSAVNPVVDQSARFPIPPVNPRHWRIFPTVELVKFAAELLDQQMWCFGRDIANPDGNILSRLGMCQLRPPDRARGSTAYSALTLQGGSVTLWGFGIFYAKEGVGSIFLRRYDFAPVFGKVTELGPVFAPEQLPSMHRPVTGSEWGSVRTLLTDLLEWLSGYEHWISETFRAAYREHCLKSRDQDAIVPAARMANEWERLAKKCDRARFYDTATNCPWAKFLRRLRPPLHGSASRSLPQAEAAFNRALLVRRRWPLPH